MPKETYFLGVSLRSPGRREIGRVVKSQKMASTGDEEMGLKRELEERHHRHRDGHPKPSPHFCDSLNSYFKRSQLVLLVTHLNSILPMKKQL